MKNIEMKFSKNDEDRLEALTHFVELVCDRGKEDEQVYCNQNGIRDRDEWYEYIENKENECSINGIIKRWIENEYDTRLAITKNKLIKSINDIVNIVSNNKTDLLLLKQAFIVGFIEELTMKYEEIIAYNRYRGRYGDIDELVSFAVEEACNNLPCIYDNKTKTLNMHIIQEIFCDIEEKLLALGIKGKEMKAYAGKMLPENEFGGGAFVYVPHYTVVDLIKIL